MRIPQPSSCRFYLNQVRKDKELTEQIGRLKAEVRYSGLSNPSGMIV